MIVVSPRCSGNNRPNSILATRPTLESPEGRVLLYSTIGGSWTYPDRITYSIVPDGTDIGGTPSRLQQVLASKSGWQQQIQKAAAAWEAVTGINLVQVPDDGSRIGTAGNQQGDSRFGDIRIGGMPQSGSQLGFAYVPPPFNGGTNAGDIFFNTSQSWQINATTYDLMTVAIHEFGHSLGMGHSAVTAAVMYAGYTRSKQTLASDDTAGIQSIYDVRYPDAFDAAASNNSSTTATDISSRVDSSSKLALADLDITSSSDVDWYKVTVPSTIVGTATMTVSMQATSLSSLVPGLTVYDASLRVPANSSVTNSGGTITITTPGVKSQQVWYIKALAGATGTTGIGAYGLLVNLGSSPQSPVTPPNTSVAAQLDLNPTTTALGTGWVVKGKFVPLEQGDDEQGADDPGADDPGHDDHGNKNYPGKDNGLKHITIGTLDGYGDTLEAGGLHSQGHDTRGDHGASERHHDAAPDHPWVAIPLGGVSAVTVTPFAVIIGAGSGRVRAEARSHYRVLSDRAETARHRLIDARLAGLGTNGQHPTTPHLSLPQGVEHPRGLRTITRFGPDT